MMTNKTRRTEIKIETHELTVVRTGGSTKLNRLLRNVRSAVTHSSFYRAAATLGLAETVIFRFAEGGRMHSMESSTGLVLVCGNSLSALGRELTTRS